MNLISIVQQLPKEDIELVQNYVEMIEEEKEELKKFNDKLLIHNASLMYAQKEFIKYLEDEKNRLSRECSNIYEDDLGKTRFVNEDIFNEVNSILQKYKEIEVFI